MARGKTLKQGQQIFRAMTSAIEAPDALAHEYAVAVLEVARRTAAGKPTPQARMAASAMRVEGDTIRLSAGGAPAEVASSSEYGSDIYLQFGRSHNSRGYWLYPSAESPEAQTAGDRALDVLVEKVVDG